MNKSEQSPRAETNHFRALPRKPQAIRPQEVRVDVAAGFMSGGGHASQ